MSEVHKHAEIASRTPEFMAAEARKPFGWGDRHFVEWAVVEAMLAGLPHGARILDVGCGVGWTTEFLARAGYDALGVDLVPANVEQARERGWLERGLTMRELRRDLDRAGFTDVRRFHQGTRPYAGARGFLGELARLVGARVIAAPQHHLWVSARASRPSGSTPPARAS